MLEQVKEVTKKIKQAKLKSVKENITMTEALKQVFNQQ